MSPAKSPASQLAIKPTVAILLCAAGILTLTLTGLAIPQPIIGQFGIGYGLALDHFVVLACIQGLIYFAAVFLLLRFTPPIATLPFILITAALFRMFPLIAPPFLSNDMYRYIWDGWVQTAGTNPYRYIPADPHLAFLRDTIIYPHINRATYAPTIYPAAAELIFAAITNLTNLLHLPPVFGTKLFLLAFEALGITAIIRVLDLAHLPRSRILIYAWNPVPIWEFASSGHVDVIAIAFIALAILFAVTARPTAAAITLAAATLTKFLPIILLPAIWRRWDKKFAAIFSAAIIFLYLPYISAGTHVLGFLSGYGKQEGIDSGVGIFLLSLLNSLTPLPPFAAKLYIAALAASLLAIAASISFRSQKAPTPRQAAQWVMILGATAMLGLSPHYPWYYPWLLLPACIVPTSSILYLVTATPLLYLNPTHTQLLWPGLVFIPFIALALRDIWSIRTAPALTGLALPTGENP